MKATRKKSIIGLIVVFVMLFCCPVFAKSAESEWTLVEKLKIDEKPVYTDESGQLAFDVNGTEIIEGLLWDGTSYTLTMDGASLKCIEYDNDYSEEESFTRIINNDLSVNGDDHSGVSNEGEVLTVVLFGDNIVASDIEPHENPSVPGFPTKKPAIDIRNMALTGEGNLEVIMLVDAEMPKHYAMSCQDLELCTDFTGSLIVEHMDAGGPAMNMGTLNINGGNLYSNAEIDVWDMNVNEGNIYINIENYASTAICTSFIEPKDVSGRFTMNGGKLKIVNHQDLFPDNVGLARGIWSGNSMILSGGCIDIECDNEAIFNESLKEDICAVLTLDGVHLTAVSDKTAAVHADKLEITDGDADLTGKVISIFVNKENPPILGERMRILEPENGYFDIPDEIGQTCYTVVNEDGDVTPRAIFTAKDHNVTFHGNGGMWGTSETKIISAKYFEDEGKYHVEGHAFDYPSKPGYSVGGWDDENGKIFTFGEVGTDIPEGGLNAYANWYPNLYTVALVANNGSGEKIYQAFVYDEEQNLYKNPFTNDGFVFTGWMNIETGETYADEECVKNLAAGYGDYVFLEAQWEELIVNLTVGDELVGEDGTNWVQDGTNLSYSGNGYTYYTSTDDLEKGHLVLDGTKLDDYYTFNYSGTEEGELTYEAPGIISMNFVRKDGEIQPQKLDALDIVVENPTQIVIKNHAEGSRHSYEKNNTIRCTGIYTYKEYGDESYPLTTITGEELSITANEKLVAEISSGIYVTALEIGTSDASGKVCVKDINAESPNKENSWTGRLKGVESLDSITIEKDSCLEVSNLTSSADRFASVEGIIGNATYIAEGASINIGNLTANAHEGDPLSEIYAVGINSYDDLENHGTIHVGQNDTKIVMNFSNDFDEALKTFAAGAEGIRCYACNLLNYGKIYVDNVVTNFRTNAIGDYDQRMQAYADGIWAQLGISNFSGAVMYSNLKDGIELNVTAPNSDDGSYFAYGILTAGTECTLLAEDADIQGRAGKMNITAAGGGATAMGLYCTIIDTTDSLIKGMANESNIPNKGINNNQLGMACDALYAKGSSYVLADGRDSKEERRGDGLEISTEWSLSDDAVIEGFGVNNNAITTEGRTLMPDLGEGYSPKLQYGADEKNTNTVYSLEGEEYTENAYAKISNKNTTHALMEHVDATVGASILDIVVSDVKEGERYFISIEEEGEEIGTTDHIASNGRVKAYLRDGKTLKKGVLYTAKLYKFRDKEASKSDFVAALEFDASDAPVTGDSNHVALFVLLIAAAAAVLFFSGRKLARK